MAGVDIRRWACVIFSSYPERQCLAGAGDDVTTREVRQVEASEDGQACRSRSVEGVPAADQWRVTRAGAGPGKGFQAVTVAAVPNEEDTRERREGPHHLIARCGCCSPGGYRSPIRLVGGSRLQTSDPRDGCPSGGRGYGKPASRSVDNDETQTPWGPGAHVPGPLVMWRCDDP